MPQAIYIVDAFTDRPFAGNPAAVCPLAGPADERWMQQVAAEMNLAETAFTFREGDGWRLRWFTPTVEVDLCGHATLAAAHVLWEAGLASRQLPVDFRTRSGRLRVVRAEGGYEMDFPALPVRPSPSPDDLDAMLGAKTVWTGTNGMDLFVAVADERTVRSLVPDLYRLATLPVRGIIVNARADEGSDYDFVSRFFGPASGVPEDPVTGSAHCALGPFWSERLGKTDLVGFQASRRGGKVRVKIRGDRVRLGGHAVTIVRGELTVAPEAGSRPWPDVTLKEEKKS